MIDMGDILQIIGVVASVIFGLLFLRGNRTNSQLRKKIKTIEEREEISNEVETMDDSGLADRISRKR